MTTTKMTVTVPDHVLDFIDDDSHTAGMNRSEYVSLILEQEHHRRLLARTTPAGPVPPPAAGEDFARAVLDWQNGAAAA